MRRVPYEQLPTERVDPRSRDLDRLSPVGIARVMNRADREAVRAAGRAAASIARAVGLIEAALGAGGRLVFAGAGTSGRLGVIEAAECPPTFGTPPALVQSVMAGGRRAVFRSVEGAEDDAADGARQIRRRARRGDAVVGIAASGVTGFVHGALREARRRGARTVLVTSNPGVDRRLADVVIAIATGPEVLAGSTRLKAGTATKLVLNTLTTASFTRLGKVHGNRMVDLLPRSAKLRARAERLVAELGGVSPGRARRLIGEARGSSKTAIAMARLGVDARAARRALRGAGGSLRAAIDGRPAPRTHGGRR
ncbi:MAG: N-acetylmuramic acid 6-phosphate etherase [Candidatus Rokubacteria bacterium]|nr:N-acetylmuramic acid 6-phosphate etherase [Candidatus Rokubacteria bacterium]